MAIDIENGFKPKYEVSVDKKQVVAELNKLAKRKQFGWLRMRTEKERPSLTFTEALKLDESKIKRIVFHEITKSAITKAVENPRLIDYQLVNAQQARRVLDRLVGFELSPVLWRKVKQGLSAGRVQSVAVRLIVERELYSKFHKHLCLPHYCSVYEFRSKFFKAELPVRFKKKKKPCFFYQHVQALVIQFNH